MNIEEDVRSMLADVTENGSQIYATIGNDDNLFETGFDSMKVINFVVLSEEKYNIELDDQDLLFANYDTINNIVLLLRKYLECDRKG